MGVKVLRLQFNVMFIQKVHPLINKLAMFGYSLDERAAAETAGQKYEFTFFLEKKKKSSNDFCYDYKYVIMCNNNLVLHYCKSSHLFCLLTQSLAKLHKRNEIFPPTGWVKTKC